MLVHRVVDELVLVDRRRPLEGGRETFDVRDRESSSRHARTESDERSESVTVPERRHTNREVNVGPWFESDLLSDSLRDDDGTSHVEPIVQPAMVQIESGRSKRVLELGA